MSPLTYLLPRYWSPPHTNWTALTDVQYRGTQFTPAACLHTKGKLLLNYCARNRKPTLVSNRKISDILLTAAKLFQSSQEKDNKDFMLNTSDTCCIHWQSQFLLGICTIKPTVQKREWCNLFALASSRSSSTYKLGDYLSPGDFLPGFGLDKGTEKSQAGYQHTASWADTMWVLHKPGTGPDLPPAKPLNL